MNEETLVWIAWYVLLPFTSSLVVTVVIGGAIVLWLDKTGRL